MTTPIWDFINKYVNSDATRMHMPGHKGVAFLGFEKYDITEIKGADSLYFANGIIAQSEANAASLFGTQRTVFSTEGSSQCIKAALKILTDENKRKYPDKGRQVVIAARNAHVSFIYAAAILDLDVIWLWPESDDGICSCRISDEAIVNAIGLAYKKYGKAPVCVYLTSPDYLGYVADVSKVSRICKSKDVYLFIDNAHGGYLRFLSGSSGDLYKHPIELGADMCCDSAHKTLMALTGGAYLHFSSNVSEDMCQAAKPAMAMMGSTSPSYLILASLDKSNEALAGDFSKELSAYTEDVAKCKERLRMRGWNVIESDPLKITIDVSKITVTGKMLADRLADANMECEYADDDYIVLMLTQYNGLAALEDIEQVLGTCKYAKIDSVRDTVDAWPVSRMTIREAMFSASKEVDVAACQGLICADPLVSCPPAIPVVVSGELIDEVVVERMKRYGVKSLRCVQ